MWFIKMNILENLLHIQIVDCEWYAWLNSNMKWYLVHFNTGHSSGLCVSPGGRFPAFSTDGKPPRKVNKGPKDLTLCRIFRQNTCCDVAQTYPALLLIRRLASAGEGSQECLHLWELLECSICDPRIGVQPGPPIVCASFCDMVFQACSSAYFSIDAKTQVIFRVNVVLF